MLFYSLLKRKKKSYVTHCCHVPIRAWCSIQKKKKNTCMMSICIWSYELALTVIWRMMVHFLIFGLAMNLTWLFYVWTPLKRNLGLLQLGCSSTIVTIKHKEIELYIRETKVEINWSKWKRIIKYEWRISVLLDYQTRSPTLYFSW